jgi:hypothetical protein
MKPMNILAAATALVLLAAPAFAANWVYVDTQSDNAALYYDADTIQRSGNQFTVWEKRDHSRNKNVKYRELKSRVMYDCVNMTFTLLSEIVYYPNGTNKSLSLTPYEQTTEDVPPDTMGAAMLKAVCRQN